jgi:hypothetical protein
MSKLFDALNYRDSAHKRLQAAQSLLKTQHYVEAIYFAGVALECMLISFIRTQREHIESGHYLLGLLAESGIADIVKCDRQEFHGLVTSVYRRWDNDLRYINLEGLKKRYKASGLHKAKKLRNDDKSKDIKGDFIENNAKAVFNSVSKIIKEGEIAWISKKTRR